MKSHRCFVTNLCCVILLVLAIATGIHAAEWTVEVDGSGDFLNIQAAVDAASSGDTIRMGPGRHGTFFQWGDVWGLARFEDMDLTFVGAGSDVTILGPEEPGQIADHHVYGILQYGDGSVGRFRNLSFENLESWGIRQFDPGRFEVEDCEFRSSGGAIVCKARDGGWIRDCRFRDLYTEERRHSVIVYQPSLNLAIERCEFENFVMAVSGQWSGVDGIVIRECTFLNGEVAIGFHNGASAEICDNEFRDISYGVVGVACGDLRIERNSFQMTAEQSAAIVAYQPPGDYYLRDNIVASAGVIIGLYTPQINWDCRDNFFFRTGPEAWYVRPADNWQYGGPEIRLDFAHNSWGTGDPDEVAAWILDGEDDPEITYVVDFLPMAGGSVRTETATWSTVRTLFDEESEE